MPVVLSIALNIRRFVLCAVAVAAGVLGVVGALLPAPAYAQGATVQNVLVNGNKRVEPETVRSYMQVSPGSAYDPQKVDASIKALFGTGLFSDVRIERVGGDVVVTVVENPVINQVAFEGNSEVDTDTLRNEVQLKPRSVFTRARVQSDVQRVLDVYRRQGRYAASVEPKIIELEQDRVNLVFEIAEGSATKVKGINFVGNKAFSDSDLRDVVSTTEKGWFDFLKGTAIYDPDRMNLDRELLRQYYLKNGYADAQVTAANAELDRDGSGFFVTYSIEEGERYDFGAVNVESTVSSIDAAKYQGNVKTSSGDTYNAQLIDKSVEELTTAMSEDGYAFARVRPQPVPDPVSRTIAINYVIEEGPRVYIERINISGNTRTKDYVIRREFKVAEGDAYNPMVVDQAKKRLTNLGLFKGVDIKRRPGASQDRVVLDVELAEQSTGELSFGAGYSTAEGVIGDVSITERNLMGNGQFLRLQLSGSMERLQVNLSFTEPRFLDRNLAAGFDIFHKEVDQSSESGFSSRRTGASLRLGFPLSERLWMQTSYTASRDSIFNIQNGASRAIWDAEGTSYTSMVGTTLTYDLRNDPRNPTKGFWFQTGADFAGLGGDVQYISLAAEARAYFPITDKITFVGRAIGGSISGWGGEDVRLIDMFFKGGETVRGFDRAGYGPRDALTGDALGGQYYWATTAEVRFPIPFVPEDLGISGAVFADAGSLWNAGGTAQALNANCGVAGADQICLQDSSGIRSSVGASLLWASPVGPIRMDFAKVLSKETYDDEQFFRFGAATKF
ncbi:outer membrane protein assembly factor BamA [Hyphomicrobium sulfonivorans]|uniref:outer membrane protein assembly factor BamA n=1 Tax=Hyphomicrobium sulfonivorans TaxID=121290 RepID=UPI001570C788|nr:outer membrane protein assembly factor BamA [Hyphomicrobium sulfonivorans]MBI1650736.1 outer membrane protein assembly factor BamA [Hyphomicrobium sulfonivorans]NSL71906.1 outer membrane protein assembly factor BamA [Hyphomicrobium sulfonivorans]